MPALFLQGILQWHGCSVQLFSAPVRGFSHAGYCTGIVGEGGLERVVTSGLLDSHRRPLRIDNFVAASYILD